MKDLDTVLSYLVGRRLEVREICDALGIGRSTYYEQLHDGRLITADNLLTAARSLGINEVELLYRYGMVSPEAVEAFTRDLGHPYPEASMAVPTRPKARRSARQDRPGLS